MTAKEAFIDFVNYVFIILLCLFCFFYFVFGHSLAIFTEFIKMLVPLAVFGIIFLIKVQSRRDVVRKMKKEREDNEEKEEIIFIDPIDRTKDEVVIFALPLVIIAIGLFNRDINVIDFAQALMVFLIMYFWHKMLFRGR
jgi:hypothetical protein